MPLDEKPNSDEISPITSQSTSPPSTNNPTTTAHSLETLQVLPKILQEGIILLASGPALLLQAAQPSLKHNLGQTPSEDNTNNASTSTSTSTSPSHPANLTTDLPTTLQSILGYIACLAFGTKEEKDALIGRLRLGQPPVPVSSNNPASQLWIIATLYATATDFYQRIYGEFDYRTAERGFLEFSLVLKNLEPVVLAPGLWPDSRAAFWKYWDEQIEQLNVSAEARNFASELMNRSDLPRGFSYMKPVMRAVAIEMVPDRIREAYGLKSTAGTRGLYRTTMGFSVAVWPALPKRLRAYPVQGYLEDMRGHLNV
ncbi:hypothetical protein BDW59DRAFT_58648 [Aspergillus cavernicola]|uniref:ER-bound oxygenase mpaB/mpaB'/Rubber oxygenase catalytic domain-containing protein n=1 Tax=Aspergillus cavernicola TaxID=176166 RepID=A0ABR4IHK4_9EURO